MKIKTPKFIMNMISKHISNHITDELGFDVYFELKSLEIDTKGRKYHISNTSTVEIDKRGLKNYIKSSIKG